MNLSLAVCLNYIIEIIILINLGGNSTLIVIIMRCFFCYFYVFFCNLWEGDGFGILVGRGILVIPLVISDRNRSFSSVASLLESERRTNTNHKTTNHAGLHYWHL